MKKRAGRLGSLCMNSLEWSIQLDAPYNQLFRKETIMSVLNDYTADEQLLLPLNF